ncbi:MAG: Gfo/Idh/MocA family oxidoreductase [Rhizobacter sp.]|nr:Gfo/Idh/MocA family oxidoreductase [Ferruginibacter sp.]
MTDKIRWGIIGCGDVTELKSGPAFNKVAASSLVAVMRRDVAKAKDYAQRHNVSKYYRDAAALIADPDINAIYIATPPGSHEAYALAAIAAGKPVYVEKPMALNFAAATQIKKRAEENNIKLVVAHYRRAQPFFNKIKELIDEGAIGEPTHVDLAFDRIALSEEELEQPQKAWRVDPAISGGGLFNDMAPHQLGLMLYYFGKVKNASGTSANSNSLYMADDRVKGNIVFDNGIKFTGKWDFNAGSNADECIIYGNKGSISFPVFGEQHMMINKNGAKEKISFEAPYHVQQPMIAQAVQYFLGKAENPCPAEEGCEVMRLMEVFTGK